MAASNQVPSAANAGPSSSDLSPDAPILSLSSLGPRKALYHSPSQREIVGHLPDANSTFINKLRIEHDVEASYRNMQKDLHKQRLKELRGLLKEMSENDWQYTPVEKLIGLQ